MFVQFRRLAAIAATLALTFAPAAIRAQTQTPGAPAATAATPSAAMSSQARAELDALASGKIDKSHYSSDIEGLDDGAVASAAQRLHARGPIAKFAFERALKMGDETVYVFRVGSANAPDLYELISWDTDGKIGRFMIGPAP